MTTPTTALRRILPALTAMLCMAAGCNILEDAKAAAESADKESASSKPDKPPGSDRARPADKGPKILACDQRDFVSEMEKKLAASTKREPIAKLACIDYSQKKTERRSSCAQGTALETPCPDDGVIATCTLETTGVVFKSYAPRDPLAAKQGCETLEGTYAEVQSP